MCLYANAQQGTDCHTITQSNNPIQRCKISPSPSPPLCSPQVEVDAMIFLRSDQALLQVSTIRVTEVINIRL